MIRAATMRKVRGMFRAREGANPYCGEIGELHVEKEVRIETILPTYRKAEVIKALLTAHPYEEPAFDLYPLQKLLATGRSRRYRRIGNSGNRVGILKAYQENL